MLKHVMAELVGQYMAQHEALQGVGRPHDDAFLVEFGTGVHESATFARGEAEAESPWRVWLVVEEDLTRPDESAER